MATFTANAYMKYGSTQVKWLYADTYNVAYQGCWTGEGTHGSRCGVIYFEGLGNAVKGQQITDITLDVTFPQSGLGKDATKTVTFYLSNYQTIDTTNYRATDYISGLSPVGTWSDKNMYNCSNQLVCNSENNSALFTALANYFSAGNNIICIYNGETEDLTASYGETATYSRNYLQFKTATITVTYNDKYSVSYNANGYGTAPANQEKVHGETLVLQPFINNVTQDSHTVSFNANGGATTPTAITSTKTAKQIEWNTASNGNGTAYDNEDDYNTNASQTFYAIWEVTQNSITLPAAISRTSVSAGNYTITYNANGGSCSTSSAISALTTSYTFGGWNLSQFGTNTNYIAGTGYTPTQDITLYAKWTSSTAAAAVTLPTPTRQGYTFKGWSTSASATTGTTGSYTPSNNVTLYAIWEGYAYTIAYNNNGGSGTMTSSSHTVGDLSKLTANTFTKSGYNFIGWSTSASATTPTYSDQAYAPSGLVTTNNQTITLYAVWSEDSPWSMGMIHLYANGKWYII